MTYAEEKNRSGQVRGASAEPGEARRDQHTEA